MVSRLFFVYNQPQRNMVFQDFDNIVNGHSAFNDINKREY